MALLASELARREHRVDLVLLNRSGPYLQELDARINVVVLPARRMLGALFPLVAYLRVRRPVVLLSALTHTNLVAIVAKCLAKTQTRVVVSERGALKATNSRLQRSRIFRLLAGLVYRRADAVIAVSEGLRREVINHLAVPPEIVHTVNNPVRLDEIDVLASEPCDHRWMEDESTRVYLAVGRLVPIKDYSTLLRAFSVVRTSVEAKLVVLGDGPLLGDLQALSKEFEISDDVEFVGFQSNPFSWMARCDAYVLSSRSEGFPNSLLQAMACGAPVVSTDCDYGPSELLAGGRWGELVAVGDDVGLGAAMLNIPSRSQGPDVRSRAQEFELSGIADQYCHLLGIRRYGA